MKASETEKAKTAEAPPEPEILEAEVITEEVPPRYVDACEADKIIRHGVYASAGIGIVPLPVFNAAAVTAGNLLMVKNLAKLYGVEFKEGMAKKIIASIVSGAAGTLATPLLESMVGWIPIIGWPLVIGSKPALNAACTYALGRMFITHFERGGNFVRVNLTAMREDFSASFKNSREWLGDKISGRKAVAAEA